MKNTKGPEHQTKWFRRKWTICGALVLVTAVLGLLVYSRVADRGPALPVERIMAAYRSDAQYGEVIVDYPLDGTLFPTDIAAPTFRWKDGRGKSNAWVVTIEFGNDQGRMSVPCFDTEWTPCDERWETIKQQSLAGKAEITVLGVDGQPPEEILAVGSISISTSGDEVGAPLFYREVNLPFEEAVKDPKAHICWRFGTSPIEQRIRLYEQKLPYRRQHSR